MRSHVDPGALIAVIVNCHTEIQRCIRPHHNLQLPQHVKYCSVTSEPHRFTAVRSPRNSVENRPSGEYQSNIPIQVYPLHPKHVHAVCTFRTCKSIKLRKEALLINRLDDDVMSATVVQQRRGRYKYGRCIVQHNQTTVYIIMCYTWAYVIDGKGTDVARACTGHLLYV